MTDTSRDRGFSLVELLVVIVVLGVLATVAVPAFLGQREKAARAAMVSDLRQVRTAQESRAVENDPLYTADAGLLDVNLSEGVQLLIRLTDGDDAYVACVTHPHVDEWLVFSSVAGTTSSSPTNCLG